MKNTNTIIDTPEEAVKAYMFTKGVSDMTVGKTLEEVLKEKGVSYEKTELFRDALWTIEYKGEEGFWRTVLVNLASGSDSWYENYDYFSGRVRLNKYQWLEIQDGLDRRY